MLQTLMNHITQHHPHWEVHMKGSLACLSCIVTPAGCITALRLYLKQARDTKGKKVCVCVYVNERLDLNFDFGENFPQVSDRGNANDSTSAYSWKGNRVFMCSNNTVGCLLWISLSVSTLCRRDCLV